jgi:hypothetical protein
MVQGSIQQQRDGCAVLSLRARCEKNDTASRKTGNVAPSPQSLKMHPEKKKEIRKEREFRFGK